MEALVAEDAKAPIAAGLPATLAAFHFAQGFGQYRFQVLCDAAADVDGSSRSSSTSVWYLCARLRSSSGPEQSPSEPTKRRCAFGTGPAPYEDPKPHHAQIRKPAPVAPSLTTTSSPRSPLVAVMTA